MNAQTIENVSVFAINPGAKLKKTLKTGKL